MIYVDSSVALAQLLFETRAPPAWLWREPLVSSRLFEYELWNRLQAYQLTGVRGDDVRAMLALVDMLEMTGSVLARALEPFPIAVRTLDGLHLATMDYMRRHAGDDLELASYDGRMQAAARALGIKIAAV
ncbi:MAG: PIN domain-containing protein [Alphaproteobacteria bacterium]|nr:PIN domain-containing protein [Alphaproteobacteria bacterium]MBV9200913.1 PIN domain-containing protein [Alphaproteobacteria bacterium]MBV9374863.1 PIN domain-containing protein [Alphaproteobacteria bacterium]MBV9816412.1 PIN domain-containing protein [Alphaproteobacteria bacterium]